MSWPQRHPGGHGIMPRLSNPDPNDSPPTAPPRPVVPVLSYLTPTAGGLVRVARCGTEAEAEMRAAALAAAGIPSRTFNGNVNALGMPYSGFADVEVHVRAQDAERAVEVLAREASTD